MSRKLILSPLVMMIFLVSFGTAALAATEPIEIPENTSSTAVEPADSIETVENVETDVVEVSETPLSTEPQMKPQASSISWWWM